MPADPGLIEPAVFKSAVGQSRYTVYFYTLGGISRKTLTLVLEFFSSDNLRSPVDRMRFLGGGLIFLKDLDCLIRLAGY